MAGPWTNTIQIDFTGAQTTALRLEAQLLDNFRGGILEWTVQ